MSSRAALIRAKSLYTFSNELNLPEGALVVAKNCNIDEPSVITPRRGFNDFGSALPTGGDRVKQLMQYKGRIIRHYDDILQWETNANDFTSFTGNYKELEEGLRIKFQESNGNLYFTTNDGIKKISATSSTNFSSLSITNSGGIKAVDLSAKLLPTEGGFLPAQSKVGYRIVFGITDANNNQIIGDPSSRFVLTNTDADVKVPEKSQITVLNNGSIADGDYITFETPQVQYAIWMNKTGGGTEPENSDLLGRTVFEVDASGATNDDVAASIATVISKNIADVTVDLSTNVVTITNVEEGDTVDIATNNTTAFGVISTIDGSVTFGSSANASITFTLPDGITNNHYYQIYRTANITVTEGITTLNDLDPGEEYNLVFESGITSTNISNGEITVEDITTENFRASGLPLYTNPITGQGILQSNSRPPIAKDIALFRNSMFYANTKLTHRQEISLLSVDDITSGTTEFIIGNQDGLSTYTFVGTPESTDFTADVGNPQDTTFTADTFASTTEGGYISIYSANDETLYIIQLDKGAAVDPAIPDSTLIQVDISSAVSAQDIKDAIESSLATNPDLIYTDVGGNDFNLINVNNGPSTTPTITSLGGAWAVGTTNTGFTLNSGYILIYSANDERKYVLLFDEGGATDPAITNSITVRVDISLASTVQDVKDSLEIALADNIDLIYTDGGGSDFTITNANNGNSTDATVNSLGGSWAVGTITQGTGEDAGNNEVLLSGLVSVSQAIDETARSLVKIINKDTNSPVIATYLSGEGDLPGQMLFENKSVADEPFYIATNDVNFQSEMSPELPLLETITTITPSGTQTVIDAAEHGLFIGDQVYISSPSSFPALGGKYEIVATTANDFTIDVELQTGDATDSFYWLADIESDNVESPNRIYFSKVSQPEAVPIVNFIDIGPQDEAIERIVALRDNLMVFKTDGIYILTGNSALTGFSVRLLDGSSTLAAPDSPAVLDNQIFCLTSEGVSTVTETGVSVISRPIEDRIVEVVNARFDYKPITFGVAYDSDKAYVLWLPEKVTDTVATQCYRYNTFERSWTRWDVPATCGLIKKDDDKMYLGAGDRQYVYQERKNGDRTDHTDRSFVLQIPDNAVNNEKVRVSNVAELESGDVILQEQYVTISYFNRLLRKLDLDNGLDNDYEDTLKASSGDNMATKLSNLNSKLIADDDSGTITSHTFLNSDWEDMQVQLNALVTELNDANCDTILKDYRLSEGITPYEAIIDNIDVIRNTIHTTYQLPLLEGGIEVFKHFETIIQWSPQHFGDPSGNKQVREGTIMFDQNNFYSAFIAYSSDLSAAFIEDSFRGKGTGYWEYGIWGDPNVYWGGDGNDIPYRTIIPRPKQRCRYLNVRFRHTNAREEWRIVGISAVVRSVSSRGYR